MKVRIGFIGGSGVYKIEGINVIDEIDVETPFGKPSDKIIICEYESIKVAFLPRHGRGHYISPSGINYRANIFALKKLGVERLISFSAVGSMKEEIAPGDIVLPDQYFDRTKLRPSSFFGNGLVAHISFDKPTCPVLREEIFKICKKLNIKVHNGGTYICIEGPQFSTLAESRIYRSWGVDVIGMTGIPEVKLAREAEMCYHTVALVTDYDCWHPEHDAVTVDMVVNQLIENTKKANEIVKNIIPVLAKEELGKCNCREALKNAIMTKPEAMDEKMKKDLEILIGKYLKSEQG